MYTAWAPLACSAPGPWRKLHLIVPPFNVDTLSVTGSGEMASTSTVAIEGVTTIASATTITSAEDVSTWPLPVSSSVAVTILRTAWPTMRSRGGAVKLPFWSISP